ncbi:EAL domain-containing protein [Vibrio lamellibrachiae]|uniref:bifunctional diguanylate cyclase/phosphodiesterase n=1 Tax=Vibrio lamellibrachiae TaxID=2910253 RepID=UPI003D127DC2
MDVVTNSRLVKVVRYFPFALVCVFISILVVMLVHGNQKETKRLVGSLESEYIENQKNTVQQRVDAAVKKLDYERNLTVDVLKNSIHTRILEAHQIATNIYAKNTNQAPSVVQKNIYDALSAIRFNEDRGYFFMFTMEGINVLHPLLPQIEGQSKIGLKDVKGKFILKEHIDLIAQAESGEAFYRWWFKKPGHGDEEFEKIGFGKYFAPYDWFIGTGEYVADVESDIQKGLLEWFSGYRFENDSYVAVIDSEGLVLSHRETKKIGKTWRYWQTMKVGEANASRLGFFFNSDDEKGNQDRLFYINQYERWGWTLVSEVPLALLDPLLAVKEKELLSKGKIALYQLLITCFIFALLLGGLSLWAGNYVNRRFFEFQNRIQDSFLKLKESQQELQYLAHHDSLTGLANRIKLSQEIDNSISRCHREHTMLAVMFVDLDDFKKVNDQYGHKIGDLLLIVISEKIQAILGKNDIAARFGGDEFIVCFSGLTTREEIEAKSREVQALFDSATILNGVKLKVSSSVGVAIYPLDGDNETDLISKADLVLYRTKEVNKGAVLFYSEDINEQIQYQFSIEDELVYALSNSEIDVVYQPQLDAKTEEIKSVEALCRWNNAKLGNIPPDQFIPIAELKGLIEPIGEYVFVKACTDILRLNRGLIKPVGLSVNISPVQLLASDFALYLKRLTEKVGIESHFITLEITENILIEDVELIKTILEELKQFGFGISLDDFGTGYCSMNYLSQLPITEIKIDRTFVDLIGKDDQVDNVVHSILAVAEVSELIVVAEGVETDSQREWLTKSGCQLLQGYYYSKPIGLDDLIRKYSNKSQPMNGT